LTTPPEQQSPLAAAMAWSARITSIALEMALPALGGYWLDGKLATGYLFTVIGAVVGMALGTVGLIRLAGARQR